ncbi:MAG: sulfite exporter TauE/SafE family protein [Sneathiellaceae bacterium]
MTDDMAALGEIAAICVAAGIVAGVFSGLLGLGGGLTTVPLLNYVLPLAGVPAHIMMHAALAAALALMIVNTSRAALVRWRGGELDLSLYRRLVWPVIVGAAIGVVAADFLHDIVLRLLFLAFVVYAFLRQVQQMRGAAARSSGEMQPALPVPWLAWPYGAMTGAVGSMAGSGAAMLTVPFLAHAGFSMQVAAAQSAGLSAAIGIVGSVAYVLAGLNVTGMPAWSLGYLYLPAMAGLLVGGFVGVPLGIRLAHRLSDRAIQWTFLCFLVVVFISMLAKFLG